MLEELKASNAEVAACVAAVRRIIALPAPPSVAEFTQARWLAARAHNRHLALANTRVQPALAASTLPGAKEAATTLRAMLLDYHNVSATHIGHWGIEKAAQDWAGFRAAVQTLAARVDARIRFEEAEIYPLLSRLAAPDVAAVA